MAVITSVFSMNITTAAKVKKTTDTPKITTTKQKRKKVCADLQACYAAAMVIFSNLKQIEQNQVHAGQCKALTPKLM